MEFADLLRLVGDEPLFETGLLLAGHVDAADVRRQLSRWTATGRIHQLRRGVYILAAPYRKSQPHPFVLANHITHASYVSGQSALAHFGLIPEYVPVVTSVTTQRPCRRNTALGSFDYRHIKADLFWGYRQLALVAGQTAFVATPEKALLDLIYLHPGSDARTYLHELRLQNLEQLDLEALQRYAQRAASPKLTRAVDIVVDLARMGTTEYQTL